jgi:hypothetical protein
MKVDVSEHLDLLAKQSFVIPMGDNGHPDPSRLIYTLSDSLTAPEADRIGHKALSKCIRIWLLNCTNPLEGA